MIFSGYLYPSATVSHEVSVIKSGGNEPIQKLIVAAISTAVDGGLFTCTVATAGVANLIDALRALQEMGYTVSMSGTTMTINW